MIKHPCPPLYDKDSEILILGSFPSVKSRENNFYYGHPQNRFWRVLSKVLGEDVPITIDEKRDMLLRSKVALWDVIEKCDIIGSSDSSIKNVVPAHIERILKKAQVKKIYANGSMAKKLYDKYLLSKTGIDIVMLPSTSPANAAYSLDRLVERWSVIKECLGDENV